MTGTLSTNHWRKSFRTIAASRWVRVAAAHCLAFAVCAIVVGRVEAQSINVSLNVRYNTPGVPTSGGTWQLVARSSNSGLAGLEVYLTGVNAPIQSSMPQGFVNGNDPAGFSIFETYPLDGGITAITVQQDPVTVLGPDDEEAIFYGVGTIANGHPGDVGPDLESLTEPQNIPWAVGNLALGNPVWNAAVLVAEGSLIPAVAPGFMALSGYRGSGLVFTSVGTDTTVGTTVNYTLLPANTIVREIMGLAGDFNNDQKVDALDYVVWRNNLGDATEADISNNGNGLNGVDSADFSLWKSHYGNMGPGGGGGGLASGEAVPEPTSRSPFGGCWSVVFAAKNAVFALC